MDTIDFNDKVAIVTGASSGIGAETARLFAEYGAKLTLVARDQTRLTNVAKDCQLKNGLYPLIISLDLTHAGSCEAVIKKTLEVYQKIDILINSAGAIKLSCVFEQSMATFDELIAINLRVPYELTQCALPHLVKTKGNVVNVGFSMLKRYRPGLLPYVVSKSALESFTKQAAAEVTTAGVRINAVSPGVARTNILNNIYLGDQSKQFFYERLAEQFPNRTIAEPKEVAILICLTASGIFPNLSGSNLFIDGASSMV